MKTRPRNCSGGSRSSVVSLFRLSLAVFWPLFAGGLALGQNQVPQPSVATEGATEQEAKYQTALKNGQAAQRNFFFLTALYHYQEALKIKPGDEVAMKLQGAMQAEIAGRLSRTKSPGTTTAPPTGEPPASAPSQNVPPAGTPAQPPVPPPSAEVSSAVPAMPKAPKATQHEVSVSGDLFFGQGQVTMPFNFSLAQSGLDVTKEVGTPDRSSTYYGGTLSYSYGQAWFLDLSYAQGSSSGNADVPLGTYPNGNPFTVPSTFTIDDQWYQAYIRYTFPGLRGKRLSAYLRGGMSYVTADLTDDSSIPGLGLYKQTDKTTDLLGNLGFGLGYRLYTTRRFRIDLQFEGEGFFGQRSQESLETLPELDPLFPYKTANIDNTLYGGIGRLTVRFEYRLGRSGLFKVFADGGAQMRYTQIEYSGVGTFDELLWGPYVKLGVRYDF